MAHLIFVLVAVALFNPLIWWLARVLPREGWQILAVLPERKPSSGSGEIRLGRNLTFYGFFIAWAALVAVALFIFLLSCLSVPQTYSFGLAAATMLCSVMASRLIAGLVEKKENTFTVAGGATVGLYLVPLLVWLFNLMGMEQTAGHEPAVIQVMAALTTAYVIGEGLGRLACISFGCCYGRPLAELSPGVRRFFRPFACRYQGATKKIAYASGLEGVPVVPIQALSAFFLVNTGLAGAYFFLAGYFAASFALTSILAMVWRNFSEQFRADYRGEGRFSAYQFMGLANIIFCLALLFFLPAPPAEVRLSDGLAALWSPGTLLFLQGLWLLLFLYFGLSRVIGARLEFHVRHEQI